MALRQCLYTSLVTITCAQDGLWGSRGLPALLPGLFLLLHMARQVLQPFLGWGRGTKDICGWLRLPCPHQGCPAGRMIILIRTDAGQKTPGQSHSMAFAVEVLFQTMGRIIHEPMACSERKCKGSSRIPKLQGEKTPGAVQEGGSLYSPF